MGFRGSNASGGRIVLLPGAFWAHGASKMAILEASLLLCILQCFGASEGMLPPGACRSSRASARRIVSCRALCASSLFPQIQHAPAPTFGVFRFIRAAATLRKRNKNTSSKIAPPGRRLRSSKSQLLPRAPLQKCVGGFLLYKFCRIFPGIFLEDFSGHFFPTNMRKNPATKSAKKSGGPKIKIREKSVLPKTDPNNYREERSAHDHHRKKIFWGTFLASKKNFPGRWWIQKPYENQKNHISTTGIFPLWPQFFSAKKSSALQQGGVCFFCPAIISFFFSVWGWPRFLCFLLAALFAGLGRF